MQNTQCRYPRVCTPQNATLFKKGATEEQAADTADWLETLGAVDDEGYAGVIVRHYGAMGYGPGRVKQELHGR